MANGVVAEFPEYHLFQTQQIAVALASSRPKVPNPIVVLDHPQKAVMAVWVPVGDARQNPLANEGSVNAV